LSRTNWCFTTREWSSNIFHKRITNNTNENIPNRISIHSNCYYHSLGHIDPSTPHRYPLTPYRKDILI
jgi:hypothetical protein